MCDPLGGSQVLPYLTGLARRGHHISLISFEKPERSKEERAAVERTCRDAGIDWHPLPYHKHPLLVSSMYDVRQMYREAVRLHRGESFDLVHCRSYLSALVGLTMKRRFGVSFIFDMRGFWADERVDGGIWKLSNPLFRAVYRYFKRREADFLAEAGQVISLTEEGRKILLARPDRHPDGPPITVIPCCVDFDAFPPATKQRRAKARRTLGVALDATVAAYLGSWGSWYLTDEMLDLFKVQLERDPHAIFLIVTREPPDAIRAAAKAHGIRTDRVVVRAASRIEVPRLIAAADYGLFFIMPVFSKKASSPTKMGEFLSLEIPVVTNGDVGDVEPILREAGAGVVVADFTPESYRAALDELASLKPDMERWRATARHWFDLDGGVERYDAIYRTLRNSAVGTRQGLR